MIYTQNALKTVVQGVYNILLQCLIFVCDVYCVAVRVVKMAT